MAGYAEYLKLDELLSLQQMRSKSTHTELVFIVVHQIYELWFRLVIEDLEAAIDLLDADDTAEALSHLRRVHEIERLMIDHMVLIDHLEPGSFAVLREALGTASASESEQFARIRLLSTPLPHDEPVLTRDLWSSFCAYARRLGLDMPSDDRGDNRNRRARALLALYDGDHPTVVELCEALLDHDHAICIWRYRHLLGAARHIGGNPGTGGTDGVAYLEQRATSRLYPELWNVRTRIGG